MKYSLVTYCSKIKFERKNLEKIAPPLKISKDCLQKAVLIAPPLVRGSPEYIINIKATVKWLL